MSDIYTGQWENDKIHGKGEYAFSDVGDVYQGHFHDNKFSNYQASDHSYYKWKDQSTFEGKMLDNRFDEGIYKFSDGHYYQGSFSKKNEREGKGCFVWGEDCAFKGNFEKDEPHDKVG